MTPGFPSNQLTGREGSRCWTCKKQHCNKSQNGQGSTCTVSKARLKSWNDTLVQCKELFSYPAIQEAGLTQAQAVERIHSVSHGCCIQVSFNGSEPDSCWLNRNHFKRRRESLYFHNPGAFSVRLRPIRSMTSVTVRSAMISLTFCFCSIACTILLDPSWEVVKGRQRHANTAQELKLNLDLKESINELTTRQLFYSRVCSEHL